MARRIRVASVDLLISEIDRKLNQLKVELTGYTLRQKVLQLVELHYESRCLGVSVVVADGLRGYPKSRADVTHLKSYG